MEATLKNLLTQRAADLMSQTVLLVPKEMSLPAAAHLLSQSHVSGAPVVDEGGRCIGVISTTDFVRYSERDKCCKEASGHAMYSWQIIEDGAEPPESVANYMTRDPVMVRPDVTIGKLACMMIDGHIHRVIVVDELQRPIGVVSSTDILAAVAQAELHD